MQSIIHCQKNEYHECPHAHNQAQPAPTILLDKPKSHQHHSIPNDLLLLDEACQDLQDPLLGQHHNSIDRHRLLLLCPIPSYLYWLMRVALQADLHSTERSMWHLHLQISIFRRFRYLHLPILLHLHI